jgi:hypothetical protein
MIAIPQAGIVSQHADSIYTAVLRDRYVHEDDMGHPPAPQVDCVNCPENGAAFHTHEGQMGAQRKCFLVTAVDHNHAKPGPIDRGSATGPG